MVFQILRDLRFADSQVLSELCLQAAIEGRTSTAGDFRSAAPAAAREVPQADAERLARLDVIRSDLIGIREQEHARARWRGFKFIQPMQWAGNQPAQHGLKLGHPRSKRRVAGAAVRGSLGRQHWCGRLAAPAAFRFWPGRVSSGGRGLE